MELCAWLVIVGRLDFDIDSGYIMPEVPLQWFRSQEYTRAQGDGRFIFFSLSLLKQQVDVADPAVGPLV